MSSNYFINDTLFWPILIGVVLLWGLFVFKEWPARYSKRFWLKTFISLLAIIALALIFLKLIILTEGMIAKAVLLTEGYDQEVLDSLRRQDKKLTIINYIKGESIFSEETEIGSLVILGQGIQKYDFWQLENVPAHYLGMNTTQGITSLFYKQNNSIGDKLVIKGNYQKAKPGTRLILEAPGGIAVDSVIFNSGKDQTFELSTDLKVAGKYLYKLTEKDSMGEKLRTNPIPVKITKRLPLKILMIDAFPTFETKYLKNYLAQAGQEVSIRTQITTGRYKYEYFNIEQKGPITFTEDILKKFDLLIIDASSLKDLSKKEKLILKRSIRYEGLGVFIQPSMDFFNTKNELADLKFKGDNKTKISLDSNSKIQVNKYPYQFIPQNRLQTIVSYDKSRLAAYQKIGLGRVGTGVLENSYQLVLDGNGDQYQDLWSKIIKKISKRAKISSELTSDQFIVFKDEPYNFRLRTKEAMPIVVDLKESKVPLKQDISISNLWKGTVYPREKGWQTLRLKNDTSSTLDYYVNEIEVWKSLISEETKLENKRNFSESINEGKTRKRKEPIDPIWFYGIFLIGMGYLWLEPKLHEA